MTPSQDSLVDKAEALQIVNNFIDRPGIIDVPDLIELFKWQNKLILWLLQERSVTSGLGRN